MFCRLLKNEMEKERHLTLRPCAECASISLTTYTAGCQMLLTTSDQGAIINLTEIALLADF